ncbi:hypothetical protein [Runella zeae]|uniref:hypothetical protein n=1 Tax=Runella zeae TaxID=94255 RepID=UPI000424DCA8|nr:hypothetical protein [Runella zeae]
MQNSTVFFQLNFSSNINPDSYRDASIARHTAQPQTVSGHLIDINRQAIVAR